MAGGEKNIKKIEKQRNGKHSRNETEISIIETRYGLRVLVRQGSNKVWLSETHLAMLFNALLARVFGGNKGEEQ